ncbi:hypothetical protein AKJ45_02225 [candidate division MSBL1 archaeon SCGC-AAA261F19]|uniref:Uncharacterized protein n=1 Tax=candidate division MSBL1 archaeon SCGC-AAA261F19 TaxID=1698275 RepID=A0A133V9U3_9EURY|nr:hypothetical protein AKJ45_02225 [candidate division MSBL1 archaeon SCGC-AAA261F19]
MTQKHSSEKLKSSAIGRGNLKEFRRKVKKIRAKELERNAIRSKEFSGEETFREGLDLINFALRAYEAGKRAENR